MQKINPGPSDLSCPRRVPIHVSQVHVRILEKIRASPFWLKPNIGGINSPVPPLTTPLHEAARTGRYELLSMMLHHARGRGMLPAACLAEDGNGEAVRDSVSVCV